MVGGFLVGGRWVVGLVESEGCSWHGDVLGGVVVCGTEKADWCFNLMVREDGNVLAGKESGRDSDADVGFLSATFFLAESCDKLLLGAQQAIRPLEQNHFTCRCLCNIIRTVTKTQPLKGYLLRPPYISRW